MNTEWSLEVYYKGYEDPAFAEDFELLQKNAQALETALGQAREQDDVQGLVTVLEAKEAYAKVLFKLNEYLGLRNSVDTTDGKTLDYIGRLDKINASTAKAQSAMDKYIAGVADLEACIAAHPLLTEYAFLLRNTKKKAVHLFSDEMEAMISRMNLTGGNAWSRLFDYLTSTLKVDYDGEQITLPAVRNLANDPDGAVRKKAYEAELASYAKIEGSIAYALNNIKSQVRMLAQERGYGSALTMTLDQSDMKRETLDAMFGAMQEYLPVFHKYMRAKAEYLGYHNGLPWFEMLAPLGRNDKKYTLEETKQCLLDSFGQFQGYGRYDGACI